MEFILGNSQMGHRGYPAGLFYFAALAGLTLVVVRPYLAFLFSVFCLSARDFHAAVFTRTPQLGQYLNLNDLLLWIALLALVADCLRTRTAPWSPRILWAIFGLLALGALQSVVQFGLVPAVFRKVWASLSFPILFLVAANMVRNEARARQFYWVLFCGSVLAAISHLLFVLMRSGEDPSGGLNQIRTISYLANGGGALLVGSLIFPSGPQKHRFLAPVVYGGLILVGLSQILSFTRSIWLAECAALLVLLFLAGKSSLRLRTVLSAGLLLGGVFVAISLFLSSMGLEKLLSERLQTLSHSDEFSEAYGTRSEGAETEMAHWLEKTPLVIGSGTVLPMEVSEDWAEVAVALSHVAYSTYLARFGLVGLLLYLVFLSWSTVKAGLLYFRQHPREYGGGVAMIGVSCALMTAAGFMTSIHLIGGTTHVQGVLFGSVWGLHRSLRSRMPHAAANQPAGEPPGPDAAVTHPPRFTALPARPPTGTRT